MRLKESVSDWAKSPITTVSKVTGIFLVQEIIFVDWDTYPLKHVKIFLDQYRYLM